jgi:hypothetical protein
MSGLGALLLVLAVGASAAVQILTDPRITRRFIYRTLLAIAVYAAHCTVGFLVVLYLLPIGTDHAAAGVAAVVVGWIGLGVLGLIRFAPRLREPPRFLARFGPADGICLLVISAGIASAAGLL